MSDKYCPMQKWSPDNTPQDMKCKEEKCAWWCAPLGKCAMICEGWLAGWKQAREEVRG